VHLEPGDDAEGVVEVGAGELPCLGGERQVVLADGADGGGLGHLDRGQRGDGRGRGGGLPSAAVAADGAVAVLLEHGDGGGGGDVEGPVVVVVLEAVAVAVDEAAEVSPRLVGVHDEVEVVVVVVIVGVVGERGGGGAGEEQRRGRRRRRWWRRRRGASARVLLDEVAVAERAEGPRGRDRFGGQ